MGEVIFLTAVLLGSGTAVSPVLCSGGHWVSHRLRELLSTNTNLQPSSGFETISACETKPDNFWPFKSVQEHPKLCPLGWITMSSLLYFRFSCMIIWAGGWSRYVSNQGLSILLFTTTVAFRWNPGYFLILSPSCAVVRAWWTKQG